MSAADESAAADDRALLIGPLAMPGFLFVLIGVRQRRPLFLLVGAVLLGLAVKRVDRSSVKGMGEARGTSAPSVPEPPPAPEPPAAPEPAAAAEPASPEAPEPDQPESA